MLKLKIPPPVYALVIGFFMWLLNQHYPIAHFITSPWNKIGIVMIVLAVSLDLSSLYLFFKKHTTPSPFSPKKSTTLVTSGLYKYTRNPMYVGLLIILTGYGVWLGSVAPFLLLPVFYWLITIMQIKPEESILEEKFGQDYLEYKNKVRRWL
ncbi:MAG: isoprenylcysteine carboxylmethyltransferase family protein [Cocleimonas sp.]